MDKKIFEAEISSSGPKGYETAAVLTMPCTQSEFRDALQRARIDDGRRCKNEVTRISYPGITSTMIGRDVDLLELNLLALRLTMLGEDDRMGLDCLLQIEKENHTTPFPLSRLINLTFNADICLLAPQVSDPKELGALLYEGEMLSDEAMALVDTMDEDSDFRERLLELLGEQHQEEHGGVFTSRGYAEPGGDFKEVYRKGEMFCFAHPSAPVVLEVRKGYFDDPSYDNDKTAILNLPAEDADIWRAVGEVDAASPDECAFRCIDCEIPSLRDTVDDAIDQEGGIGMASEFAANLAQKKQSWHEADWVKYKALLSVAGRPSLLDAIQLMHGLEDYDLRPEVAATYSSWSGVKTRIGEIGESVWYQAAEELIREKGEQELLGYLTQWCSERNFLKESAGEIRKKALQLHVDRIFDHPRWVDFVPFNRRYRPDVLKTAHLVTVISECCQKPGVVTQEQIDAAYEGTIACPCCGKWSHFDIVDSPGSVLEQQAEQMSGMEMT